MKIHRQNIAGSLVLAAALALAMSGCGSGDPKSSSALPSASSSDTGSQTASVSSAASKEEQTSVSAITNPEGKILKQIDFAKYSDNGQTPFAIIRAQNGKIWYNTLTPLTEGEAGRVPNSLSVGSIDIETGEATVLETYADEDMIRVLDLIDFQGSQILLQAELPGDSWPHYSIFKDGELIAEGETDSLLNMPRFTQCGDRLLFVIGTPDDATADGNRGRIYAIEKDFSVHEIYSSPDYVWAISSINASGNFAFGFQDPQGRHFAWFDETDQPQTRVLADNEQAFPISTGFLLFHPNEDGSYHVSYLDKKSGETTDLNQDVNGMINLFTPLENNTFIYHDSGFHTWFGQLIDGALQMTPMKDIPAVTVQYYPLSRNEQVISVSEPMPDKVGSTTSYGLIVQE